MKLTKCTVWISCILCTIAVLLLAIAYSDGYYFPWQRYKGEFMFPTKSSDVESFIADSLVGTTFTVNFAQDDSVDLNVSDFASPIVSVNKQTAPDWLLGKSLSGVINWDCDEDALKDILHKYYEKNKNAELKLDKDCKVVLLPDSSYREFDVTAVARYVEVLLNRGEYIADLYADDVKYTVPAKVTESSLQDKYNSVRWLNDFCIEYSCGTKLDSKFFYEYYTEDFSIDTSKLDLTALLDSLEDSYDTVGKTVTFTKHDGKDIEVKFETLGKHVYRDEETQHILDCIEEKKSESNRVPETYGVAEIGDSYIEVSLDDQHVWHYVKGKLCCESDCVTGKIDNRHETPTGVYYISEKKNGKVLTPVGASKGTWVNYWLRISNSGVGLHDAGWRGRFGGTIYKYSGSHGCINLPPAYAARLFKEVQPRLPVVVY